MTAIPHTFWFNHLTWVEGLQWRGLDHDAAKIVKGLKGEKFNGYVEWKIGQQWRRFTPDNIDELVGLILETLGGKVADQVKGDLCVVPIPNSQMAVAARGKFRIVELGQIFAAGFPSARLTPSLVWATPREKAHKKKGWRTPEMFQPHLRLVSRPEHPVILFDDVFTSGSQCIAATRFLRENGCEVIHIATVAKAGRVQIDNPFEWRTEMVEIDYQGLDFDEF